MESTPWKVEIFPQMGICSSRLKTFHQSVGDDGFSGRLPQHGVEFGSAEMEASPKWMAGQMGLPNSQSRLL
jgi:hypothetical protein